MFNNKKIRILSERISALESELETVMQILISQKPKADETISYEEVIKEWLWTEETD